MTKDGEFVTDYIGTFENLHDDFDYVCSQIGVKKPKLEHHRGSHHEPYQEYYSGGTQKLVAKYFAMDIERFEYEFK